MKIAVLGAGSWGTALAVLLSNNGHQVSLWSFEQEQCDKLKADGENKTFLPGVLLPEEIAIDNNISCVSGQDVIVLAVPSHAIHSVVRQMKVYLSKGAIIVNVAKGFEPDTYLRLSEVIQQEVSGFPVVVLSGPSHAEEVGKQLPAAVVIAGNDESVCAKIQDVFMNEVFRVYTNHDLVGVEVAGAVKNVIALGCGIIQGLNLGDNARAALITRGVSEIARLGVAMGAEYLTFAGLAGIGDLVVTCSSYHSRNFRAGIQLAEGKSIDLIIKDMGMVVEGVLAANNTYALSKKYNVEMPIVNQIYRVLYEGQSPRAAMLELMTRTKKTEAVHN